jgi:mannose-6-phosphate isomerase-like protein (cupin superfamily)
VPARVYDYRDDPNGTIVATDQVRAKFLKREPGQELRGSSLEEPLREGARGRERPSQGAGSGEGFHSHVESGGVETWLILEGAARFDFKDGSVTATAGQAVFSWPDEPHRIVCVGDRPVVYFLTVSPHREPTHTHYDADWNQLPSRNSNLKPTWRGEPSPGVDGRR